MSKLVYQTASTMKKSNTPEEIRFYVTKFEQNEEILFHLNDSITGNESYVTFRDSGNNFNEKFSDHLSSAIASHLEKIAKCLRQKFGKISFPFDKTIRFKFNEERYIVSRARFYELHEPYFGEILRTRGVQGMTSYPMLALPLEKEELMMFLGATESCNHFSGI